MGSNRSSNLTQWQRCRHCEVYGHGTSTRLWPCSPTSGRCDTWQSCLKRRSEREHCRGGAVAKAWDHISGQKTPNISEMRGTGDGPIAPGKTQRRWLAVIAGRHPGTRGRMASVGGKHWGPPYLKQTHQISSTSIMTRPCTICALIF